MKIPHSVSIQATTYWFSPSLGFLTSKCKITTSVKIYINCLIEMFVPFIGKASYILLSKKMKRKLQITVGVGMQDIKQIVLNNYNNNIFIPNIQINKFRYFISSESDDDDDEEEEEEEEDEDEELDAMYENSMKKVPDQQHITELQLSHGKHVINRKPSRD